MMKGLHPDTGQTQEEWLRDELLKLESENAELQTKIDTAIEQLNEHIHEDKHHLDDILFELEGGADSIKLELCDE